MAIKRRSYIAISILATLILSLAIWWWREQIQIQTRLNRAKVNVGNATDTFRQSLGSDFMVSQEQTLKTHCEEASPEFSFTRLYDCNATASLELWSKSISTTRTEVLIKAALSRLGVESAGSEDVGGYAQSMNEASFWQTALPINIPHSAIAGVPPFNYYGGVGQEDIGLKLVSKIDQNDPKKTILSVTAIQEYHSCKSFFVPCVSM